MEWSEQPEALSEGGAVKYTEEAEQLRKYPGHSAMLEPADSHDMIIEKNRVKALRVKAASINSGRQAAFRPGGDFHAVVRWRDDDMGFGLWVTYTGDVSEGRADERPAY